MVLYELKPVVYQYRLIVVSGSPTHWRVYDPILHIKGLLYCFRLFPEVFQIFLIYMMSFLTVTHIPTRRNVLYPEPLGFKSKLRLSSKRTHLVQSTSSTVRQAARAQAWGAPGSEHDTPGCSGGTSRRKDGRFSVRENPCET